MRETPSVFGAVMATIVRSISGPTMAVLNSGPGRRLLGASVTEMTYTGRKSGQTFRLPVAYRRAGQTITVIVLWARAKTWWRNFDGDGAPISVLLDGEQRPGYATARRLTGGVARVTITLDR